MLASGPIGWSSVNPHVRTIWEQLLARVGVNLSASPGWIEITARALGDLRQPLHAYLSTDASGELQGIVPYYFSRQKIAGVPMRALQLGTNRVAYHPELICTGDASALLVEFMERVPAWDVMQLSALCTEGPTATAVRSLAAHRSLPLIELPGDESPYILLQGSFESYLGTRNKKFRYKLRKRKDSLAANGNMRLTWFEGGDTLERLLAAIIAIEAQSWKAQAGLDIPGNAAELAYYRELLPYLAARRALLANVLYIGEEPAAYSLCCRDGGWIGQLKTSFDERFKSLSVGGIVIDACVERAFALGATEFDFLGATSQHKRAWTDHARRHSNYFLFAPTPKGRCVAYLYRFKQRMFTLAAGLRRQPAANGTAAAAED